MDDLGYEEGIVFLAATEGGSEVGGILSCCLLIFVVSGGMIAILALFGAMAQ